MNFYEKFPWDVWKTFDQDIALNQPSLATHVLSNEREKIENEEFFR